MRTPLSPPVTVADHVLTMAFRICLGLSVLAIALMAGLAFAQGAPAATPAPAADPAWLKLAYWAFPILVGWAITHHVLHLAGQYVKAQWGALPGWKGAIAREVAVVADEADDLASKDQQQLVDMIDPAKRPAAEQKLVADARAAAPQAAADVVKGAL